MIVSLWGVEGCGKSSLGLTYPKPLFHLDLDVGGFERAIWRVEEEAKKSGASLQVRRCEADEDISKINWSEYGIVSKPYLAPIQLDKMLGVQTPEKAGVSVRFPRQVTGVKEMWQSIVNDIVEACKAPAVKSIMVDSATQLWWVCHTSLLQEKQEIQLASGGKVSDSNFRERLQPMEFPNSRMRDLIYTVRSMGKNLIMTHYPKDIYAEKVSGDKVESYKTGKVEPDGFKHTVTLDDIVLWCYTEIDKNKEVMVMNGEDAEMQDNPNYKKPQPFARVDIKCGLPGMGMKAVGMELPAPSYEGLMELQASMRAQ